MSNDQDLKQLASALSESYSAYLKNANAKSLNHLNEYNSHLPLSWYTPQLLNALQSHYVSGESNIQPSIVGLWSTWIRRLVLSGDDLAGSQQHLAFVVDQFEQILTGNKDTTSVKYTVIALSCLTGLNNGVVDDDRIAELLNKSLHIAADVENDQDLQDTVDASLSYFVANATSQEALVSVLENYVSTLGRHLRRVFYLVENAADLRWRQKNNSKALIALWQALQSVHDNVSDKAASSAATAGFVRMLQFAKGNRSKSVRTLEKESENIICTYLNDQAKRWKLANVAAEIDKAQDVVLFLASQCVPALQQGGVKSLEIELLLDCLVDGLINSTHTWRNGAYIRDVSWSSESTLANLERLTTDAMFKDIGRLCRAIGKLIQVTLETPVKEKGDTVTHCVQPILERLTSFSYNLYVDWDACVRQVDYPSSYEPPANTEGSDQAAMVEDRPLNARIYEQVWNIHKTVLFGYTTIFLTTAVDAAGGVGLNQIDSAAQQIVLSYANLNFISDKLGSASSFQAYQNTLTSAVTFLKTDGQVQALNDLLQTAFREHYTSKYTIDNALALSEVQQKRALFFVDLLEQVLESVDDNVLENDILPVIYQLLNYEHDKALFESAHAVVLCIFETKKPISRELACVYAKTLLDSYPQKLSHQQLRLAYTNMVQALCEIDDSVAWLTVNHLRKRIDSFDATQVVDRSHFLITYIDQMKPVSLGPFFGMMMKDIGGLIKDEPIGSATALLKIVYETVSGNGISDMRRVDAVGWYLQLKQDIEKRADSEKHAAQ